MQCEGQRNKLVACDGNEIDTMFVDRRREEGLHGQTLVGPALGSMNHLNYITHDSSDKELDYSRLYEPSALHYPCFPARSVVLAVCCR